MNEADKSIRLTADLSLTKSYTISGETEIDLNGHELIADINTAMFIVNGGKLTLKGGTASNRGQIALVSNGGQVIIENGSYTSTKAAVFRAGVEGTVIVNDGNLTGQEGAVDSRGKGTNGCGATITINNGKLTGVDNFAIATNGSAGMGNNRITINGGELEGNIQSVGYEAIGVYIANNDTFIMNGGSIKANGGTGLCMRAGNVTINGGTIIATNVDKNGNIVTDGKIGDDPTILEGCSAIIYHETANYPGKEGMRLTIKGGTITGIDHAVQVLSNEATPNVHVSGGNFTPAYPET